MKKMIACVLALCMVATVALAEDGSTYVWVGYDVDPAEMALASESAEPTFTVDSVAIGGRTLGSGDWVNGFEAITLATTDTVPDNTYTCKVSTDGGALFTDFTQGSSLSTLGLSNGTTYDMVFQLTGSNDPGNIATLSITLTYDNEAPAIVCKGGADNTLIFFAGDALSGFASDTSVMNVTFDATASPIHWTAHLTAAGQNVYTYSVRYASSGTIPAGMLAVRDQAGNIAVWNQTTVIASSTGGQASGGGTGSAGGSGGSSGGVASRTVYHSESDYDTVIAYNGVELVVQTGAMRTLTIGDQALDLCLLPADGGQTADGTTPGFFADFTGWNRGSASDTTDASEDAGLVDTLVLEADQTTLSDPTAACWTFDGSVYKKLAASGIDYLVLRVGDHVTALSTAGFAAGIRYNMYRAAGLASKAFVYTIRMGSDVGELSIEVTVDGQTYPLTADQTGEFYYYDVYSGTMDMLSMPFGQSGATQTASRNTQG